MNKIAVKNYVCHICGKSNVKLWRPYGDSIPLVCAECAEKRQTPLEYDERIFEKEGDHYIERYTKRKQPLPKWKVDERGEVPSYHGPGPNGLPVCMTDQLIIDLSDFLDIELTKSTTMIPACPNEEGKFFGYTSAPVDLCKWWVKLPTR